MFEQILPNENNYRRKRGLFNPLGTFIKSITGNLDQSDAEQIDAKIKQLQDNQNKIKIDAINQITILDNTVKNIEHLILNISHNEYVLKSRILQIEAIIKQVALNQTSSHQYYLTHTIINQIIAFYQSIYDILNKIEISITFAKLNILYNAILNPKELLIEIKKVNNILSLDKLPLEPKFENILNFEKIITIKSYIKNFNIVYILELPLVEADTYQYFKLFPVPIPNNHIFHVNIPYKPYLTLSDKKYAYESQECLEVQPQNYLCKEARTAYIEEAPSCAVQLIKHHQNISSCHPFQIMLQETQITKIANGKWLVTVPKLQIGTIICQNSQNNVPLTGSYLIEASTDCKIRLKSKILEAYKASRLTFSKVSLPKLNLSLIMDPGSIAFNPPSMDLNQINLKLTKDIEAQIKEQKKHLQEVTSVVYVNRTSFWTICLYILFIITLISFVYRKCIKPKKKSNKSIIDTNNDQNNIF